MEKKIGKLLQAQSAIAIKYGTHSIWNTDPRFILTNISEFGKQHLPRYNTVQALLLSVVGPVFRRMANQRIKVELWFSLFSKMLVKSPFPSCKHHALQWVSSNKKSPARLSPVILLLQL